MITLEDYFGPWLTHKDATPAVVDNAEILLDLVNDLLEEAFSGGVDLLINPVTQSYVSGRTYRGFRPQDCPQGSPSSSHKTGQGIDIYDYPLDALDKWCLAHPEELRKRGLHMEHPDDTPKWCHLTTRSPKSGKTVFKP